MSRSDQARLLIAILLAFLGWTIEPTRLASAEEEQAEKQEQTEAGDKKDADDTASDKKPENSEPKNSEPQSAPQETPESKPAAGEKGGEEKPAEAKLEAAPADKEKPDADQPEAKPTEKEKAGPGDASGEKKAAAASGGEKAADQKAAVADKVNAARKEAAKVVVEQLKAAAAAVGIASDEPAEAPAPDAAPDAAETKGDGTDGKKTKRKKKAPQLPMFRMRDGTRIAGHAEVSALRMTTAYGSLEVPVTEIVQVRFCSPRDTRVGERVAVLVGQLGSDEFDLREEASEELRGIGVAALDALREAMRSDDQEVKTRAEKLVAELEDELQDLEEDQRPYLVPLSGDEDEVVTLRFTAVGLVDIAHFLVKTPYGQLKLDRDEILSIVFRPPPFRQHTFEIGGSNAYAANNKWVDTGLKLTQGGFLKITAAGSLNLANYGTTCSPDGTSGTPPNGLESFPVGALVGKIGSKGKPFLIGSEYEGTANATGNLQLGISFKSGSTRGQFEVEVEVEIEED